MDFDFNVILCLNVCSINLIEIKLLNLFDFMCRWAAIAAHLTGRTDNDVKNYWYTHMKKKLDKVDGPVDEPTRNPVAPSTLALVAAPHVVAPTLPPTLDPAAAPTVASVAPPTLAPAAAPPIVTHAVITPAVTHAATPVFAHRCVLPTPAFAHASVFAPNRAVFDNPLTAPATSFASGRAILDYSFTAPAPAPNFVRGREGFN